MTDMKNIIITIALCGLMLFGWQYYTAKQENHQSHISHNNKHSSITDHQFNTKESVIHHTKNDRVTIHTPKMSGTILLKGLKFDDLTLNEFTEEINSHKSVSLLSPNHTKDAYLASFGWISTDHKLKLPDVNSEWKASSNVLSQNNPIILSWDNNNGLIFSVRVEVDDNYLFSITNIVLNKTSESVNLLPYGLISKLKEKNSDSSPILHEGPVGVFNEILHELSFEKIREKFKEDFKNNKTGWLGLTDKYWLTAIVPDIRYSFDASFTSKLVNKIDKFQVDYLGHPIQIHSGDKVNYIQHFFAGPKHLALLDKYEKDYTISHLDYAIDFGWLYFITKPILITLQAINKFTGNFGIAILLLTVLIKLLMLPLANRSYISISKMKALAPVVKRLKEKYKDDKMRFNYELMQLYKREKVNPLSGCVPILIQIPVFFALYKVLYISIEMRHAPFFGWIHDLSMPDPTSVWNLFGLAPWAAPAFLAIGIWPIIMGITMFFQQRLNPEPTDPVQAQMMKFMPIIFVFMFYKFPVGLVIYWAWNNILSITQQWYINKKVKKDMHVF